MNLNDSEIVNNASKSSVFSCWYYPSFSWEFSETTFPWVVFGITVFFSPVIVLLNVLEIAAVLTRKQLQRASTLLLCSMAVVDVLVGAVAMPLAAAVDLLIAHQTFLDNVCVLDFVGLTVMYCASWTTLSHLTVIAWERYVAIVKWREYKVMVTRQRVKKLTILAWLPAVIVATRCIVTAAGVDVEGFEKLAIIPGIFWGAAVILIVCFYTRAYLILRKRKVEMSQNCQVSILVRAKLNSKVAKTTGIITGTIIFTFLLPVAGMILGPYFEAIRKGSVFRLIETVMQLNSLANPLIYCYRDRSFRKTILELLRFKKPEANQATGVLRFVRRKKLFHSQEYEFEYKMKEKDPNPLRKTASFPDVAVVLVDFDLVSFSGSRLSRHMSAPSLDVRGARRWESDPQSEKLPCPAPVTTTITVNDQPGNAKHSDPKSTLNDFWRRKIPRSKSQRNISVSSELASGCRDTQDFSTPKTDYRIIKKFTPLGRRASFP